MMTFHTHLLGRRSGTAYSGSFAHVPCRNPATQLVSRRGLQQRQQIRATAEVGATQKPKDVAGLFTELDGAYDMLRRAPLSEKYEYTSDILSAFTALKEQGAFPKWGIELESPPERRNVVLWELKRNGIKVPESIGVPSVRNDAAFLFTVVGTTSVVAVAAGQLPGDWGFFVPYLTGGISLAVLAIGSTAPGLLSFFIDKFSRVFPDYRERVLKHEAAHFLVGYLMGVPVTGYSLDIGRAHTDFAEAKLQKRLIEGFLTDSEVDQLAVIAMAGATAEGMQYEDVIGQTADLIDLQRILNRSKVKMKDPQQQNMTRWAVYQAGGMLKKYQKEYEALQAKMQQGASVPDCIKAIEAA